MLGELLKEAEMKLGVNLSLYYHCTFIEAISSLILGTTLSLSHTLFKFTFTTQFL